MLETIEETINQEIGSKVSKALISSEQQEYLNELLPSINDWNTLTSPDKITLGGVIVARMDEIASLNGLPTEVIEQFIPSDLKPMLT